MIQLKFKTERQENGFASFDVFVETSQIYNSLEHHLYHEVFDVRLSSLSLFTKDVSTKIAEEIVDESNIVYIND